VEIEQNRVWEVWYKQVDKLLQSMRAARLGRKPQGANRHRKSLAESCLMIWFEMIPYGGETTAAPVL
jgi:hypothetical protein